MSIMKVIKSMNSSKLDWQIKKKHTYGQPLVYVVIVVYDVFSFPLNSNLTLKTFKQK